MELRLFLSTIMRGWLVIALLVALGLIVTGAAAKSETPTYQATTRLYLGVQSASDLNDLAQANAITQQVIGNYAQLAQTSTVLARAAQTIGLDAAANPLAGSISTAIPGGTAFLDLTATADTATRSVTEANAVADALIVEAGNLTAGSSDSKARLVLTIVQPASTPSLPTNSGLAQQLLIGAVVGLLVALALLIIRERLDPRFQSVAQIVETTGGEVVGTVPRVRTRRRYRADGLLKRRGLNEAFRSLRASLIGLGVLSDGGTAIAITSASAGEGRTSTTAVLGIALAASGRAVVLVEADFAKPRLAELFEILPVPGLTDVLRGQSDVVQCMQDTRFDGLRVLTAGAPDPAAADLVESDAMNDLLARLTSEGVTVLIDTPPLLATSHAAVLARRSHHVLFVIDGEDSRQREVRRGLGVLAQMQSEAPLVVVNDIPFVWADSMTRARAAYRRR